MKNHILAVIKNKMKTKCFEKLRQHMLPIIEGMFQRSGRTFSEKVFKKHFWSYFLKDPENLDVKVSWKKLPRTKPGELQKEISIISEESEGDIKLETPSIVEQEENGDYTYEANVYEGGIRGFPEEDPDRFFENYSEGRNQDFHFSEQVCLRDRFLPLENFFETNNLTQDELLGRPRLEFDELDFCLDGEGHFGRF